MFLMVGGGVLAVIAVVVGVLYFMGGNGSNGGGFFERITGGVSSITGTQTPGEMAESPYFAFRRVEVDTTRATPEACLVFTRSLDHSGKTTMRTISVDPTTRVAARVVDDRSACRA